jgi:hypothetical protein
LADVAKVQIFIESDRGGARKTANIALFRFRVSGKRPGGHYVREMKKLNIKTAELTTTCTMTWDAKGG